MALIARMTTPLISSPLLLLLLFYPLASQTPQDVEHSTETNFQADRKRRLSKCHQFVDEVTAEVKCFEFDEAWQRRRQVLDEVLTKLQRLQVRQAEHTHTQTLAIHSSLFTIKKRKQYSGTHWLPTQSQWHVRPSVCPVCAIATMASDRSITVDCRDVVYARLTAESLLTYLFNNVSMAPVGTQSISMSLRITEDVKFHGNSATTRAK